jgi:hypothetical protein
MKTMFALFAVLASSTVLAQEIPLLKKTTGSGFVMWQWAQATNCEIFADRVVKSNWAAGLSAVETVTLKIEGDMAAKIAKAAEGPFSEEPGIIDGPTKSYVATMFGPRGEPARITLFATGEGRDIENQAPEAVTLRNFLDLLCN